MHFAHDSFIVKQHVGFYDDYFSYYIIEWSYSIDDTYYEINFYFEFFWFALLLLSLLALELIFLYYSG